MKIISYAGAEGENIVIQRPQDLYPLLDWFQTQIMDLGANDIDVQRVSELMKVAEDYGLGNYDDVEGVEFS